MSIGIGYAVSCQVVSRIVPYFPLRRLLIVGLLCLGISTSFYGPSEYLGFQSNLWISSAALFFAGLTSALSLLPVIPEIIQESNLDPKISVYLSSQTNIDILNDHTSGLFNFFFAVGNTIGPLLGNYMYVALGCPATCDFLALYLILFAILYFLLCDDLFTKKVQAPSENSKVLKDIS